MIRQVSLGVATAILLAACAYGGGPGGGYGVADVDYDGYYDDFYGPFDDGYWGPDNYFYFSSGGDHHFRRDEGQHFRHESTQGFHPIHGHHAGGGGHGHPG
ncbi:MAG TPA: hypothetical protein VHY34_12515 [Caulobacteraceae bacterium]|jgi:hypothetical protein|nr:hypothetical protein [Caulobacteraceae bacterium]